MKSTILCFFKRLSSAILLLVIYNSAALAMCGGSHPYECGGNCYVDAAQAQSGGCSGGNNNQNPPPPPPPSNNSSCGGSHPYECGGTCYVDAAQAQSAGCSNGNNNQNPPPPPPPPPPNNQNPPPPPPPNSNNGCGGGSGQIVSGCRTSETQADCDTNCVTLVGNGNDGCLNAAGIMVSRDCICSDPDNAKEAIIDIEFNLGIDIDDEFIAQSGYQGVPPSLNPRITLADAKTYFRALLGAQEGNQLGDDLNLNGDAWLDRNEASQAKGADPQQTLNTRFGCGLSTDDVLAYIGLYLGDGAIDKYAGDLDQSVRQNMLEFTRSWQPGTDARDCEYRGGCN